MQWAITVLIKSCSLLLSKELAKIPLTSTYSPNPLLQVKQIIEDFSRSTKMSKSLYFSFPFSCLREYRFPCFTANKIIFHQVHCGNSYTAEGVPLHLSTSLVNSRSPAKLLLCCVRSKPWKSLLTAWIWLIITFAIYSVIY